MRITDFEIINHGYDHGQYFQGCGVALTSFAHVVTGSGMSAKDAYESAREQAWNMSMVADASALPKRPAGIRARDRVPADCRGEFSEVYWYVSIRFNVAEE